MPLPPVLRAAGGCVALAALVACAPPPPPIPPERPVSRPAERRMTAAVARPKSPSAESVALRGYYARVQSSLLAQGLLRTDGGGPDTPFDARRLADTFIRVALFNEYDRSDGRLVARENPSRLYRWAQPVRIDLRFGASVPADARARDTSTVAAYAARLSRVSGRPVGWVPEGGNFTVFVVNEDERRTLGPALRRAVPGISDATVRDVTDMPRDRYCLVFGFDTTGTATYDRAVAVVRAEHPDLLSLSCLHEEIAQGLGLTNDSPTARPSIFNDDEEFGLLTTHDELLLRMLYDPRMRPGMTADEARPVADEIARELLGGTG